MTGVSFPENHMNKILPTILCCIATFVTVQRAAAQSADWTEVVFREPQVRYLLADMTGGGKVEMYRKYATEERDPDSREAIRRWDAGVRVLNMADFDRGLDSGMPWPKTGARFASRSRALRAQSLAMK